MRVINDFKCTDPDCSEYEKVVERMYIQRSHLFTGDTVEEEQYCEQCNQKLIKIPSGIRAKHISWSKWRV